MPDMAKHQSLLPSNLIQIPLTQHIMTILLSFLYPPCLFLLTLLYSSLQSTFCLLRHTLLLCEPLIYFAYIRLPVSCLLAYPPGQGFSLFFELRIRCSERSTWRTVKH